MVIIYLSFIDHQKIDVPKWVPKLEVNPYVIANKWVILEPRTSFSFYEKFDLFKPFLDMSLDSNIGVLLNSFVDASVIKTYDEIKHKFNLPYNNATYLYNRIYKIARSTVVIADGGQKYSDIIMDVFIASLLKKAVILVGVSGNLDTSIFRGNNIIALPNTNTQEIIRQILAFTLVEELLNKTN